MDLIAIVVTVCALAHPDHCEEQRLEYMWNGSLTQCAMTAQPYIAQWIGEHPKWSVKRYHCEYPHAKEGLRGIEWVSLGSEGPRKLCIS
jgi:hypothetical protein